MLLTLKGWRSFNVLRIGSGNRSRACQKSCRMVPGVKTNLHLCRRVLRSHYSYFIIVQGPLRIWTMELVNDISSGSVDLTFGSALDIFGGSGVRFDELVHWNLNKGPRSLA
jgi:hypothetical protein